jgi:hypothetical protein
LATQTSQFEFDALLAALLRGELTEAQSASLAALGVEAMLLALMAANARLAQLQSSLDAQALPESASAPPASVPVYLKGKTSGRKKKPGAKNGHKGSRRKTPAKIDARVGHRLDVCPCCSGPLQKCERTRTRIIEDIPRQITPVVTEHTIHRDYCPVCKKHVEPVVGDAMPNATLGHHVVALGSWFHYGLGVTVSQVREILASHLNTQITAGGLVDGWRRLAGALLPWYEQIGQEAKASAVQHADETGWRVAGATWWLWCFCTLRCCYYLIDPSRGSPALQKFFIAAYQGTLVSDFWAAYNNVWSGDKQKCLAHLLRELLKVDEYNLNIEWKTFSKQLRRLVRDGLRLRKRPDFTTEKYKSRIALINKRLWALAEAVYEDADAIRLGGRIGKHRDWLFTFLDTAGVPPDNNHAERMIRPAVIIRKNSLCNRSEQGAATQAILMSVYRTLKLRGLNPTETIAAALRTCLETGSLPPLPAGIVAAG